MKIALCSDEPYPVHATLRAALEARGHVVEPFGSVKTGTDAPFALAAEEAALAVARGECDLGVLCCWTGTGISIAANKVHGVRAALCTDPGTARGCREWNHANVLCLSNRLLSDDMAKEILSAFLDAEVTHAGDAGVKDLDAVDDRHRLSD